ncbi:MAG TPA: response regulator [Candidatus Dormibacteraeota bacterium]|nr:response regulator [Candidatus Dormibacteraeota bacterium]
MSETGQALEPGAASASTPPSGSSSRPPRLLVIDDNAAIHEDFRKILSPGSDSGRRLDDLEQALFGKIPGGLKRTAFRVDSALQGQEALAMLEQALTENDPYVLAFVDIRMPPGWDGIETLARLWERAPELQAVICSAYSDYSWEEISRRLTQADSLLILKKPFDTTEVLQMAHALSKKWELARAAKLRMEDLDRMVRERTLALEQEVAERSRLEAQLRHAQKMEAIGCLASGIAHEFNNLLTVVQGHAGLLRGRFTDGRSGADSVERISQASTQAASLTRRLLAFSRKQALQLRPLNISSAVQNMERMLGRLLGERYELRLQCAPEIPFVNADEASIQQVLINLVLNARDAMAEGGPISISIESVELDNSTARKHLEARTGHFIRLRVADTGCGMSEEVRRRIFDPFFTTKEVGKGTGLGLSTVHGIIQQHEGWIQVETESGKGAAFSIFLPITTNASDMVRARPANSPALFCGKGEAVLIVEDESTVREMARIALEQGGYRVFEAADGPQAIDTWQTSPVPIELLVTDMVMPKGISGAALARELKAKDPALRTLFISGYSSEALQEDHSVLTSDNFLPKPYDPLSLLKKVRSCLALPGQN